MLTKESVSKILAGLESRTADDLETEELEFKAWDDDPRSMAKTLREAVVCLANCRGGAIVVGVKDKVRGRKQAITGIGVSNPSSLKKAIYDGTDPHILVELEELNEPEGTLLLIHVPRGMPPHTTSDGVGKIRIGKECRPLTGQLLARLTAIGGQVDPSDHVLEEIPADADWIDPDSLNALRAALKNRTDAAVLSNAPTAELLEGLSLVDDGHPKLAGLLLIGKSEWIKKYVIHHGIVLVQYKTETTPDRRPELKGSLFEILRKVRDWVDLYRRFKRIEEDGVEHIEIPNIEWDTAREALLNAVCHRDYFQRRPIVLSIHKNRLEVESPGGFIGGVNKDNILRHAPVHRNELLGRVFVAAGLVEQLGVGVDRMFLEHLRNGKDLPRFESSESFVRLILPFEINEAFVRMVRTFETRGGPLDLNDLLLLRSLLMRPFLDRWSAAEILGRTEDESSSKLAALRERGLLTVRGRGRGTGYVYAEDLRVQLLGSKAREEMDMMDSDAVKAQVVKRLGERGKLTNKGVREFSGYSAMGVYKIFKALEEEGILEFTGKGRAAHVVSAKEADNKVNHKPRRRKKH